MVLVDTSVWIDHFKHSNDVLMKLLGNNDVVCHPLVIAEIACGTPPSPRERVIADLKLLKLDTIASMSETLTFIENNQLFGRGGGYIDFNILASTILNQNATLWTLDKRLAVISREFDIAFD